MLLPKLDTEEKLRAYLNKIACCEVDPLTIKAHIYPNHVYLAQNLDPGIHIATAQSSPRWFQIQGFGMVDHAVLPVLKELHARHDKEIQANFQKRLEESCEREVEKAARRAQCLEQENAYHQRALEKMASIADMTPDRFMDVKRGLEKKLTPPSLLTRILNLFK